MFVMALMSLGAHAQNVTKPGEPYSVFCDVAGYNTWGYGKVNVRMTSRLMKVWSLETRSNNFTLQYD